MKTKASGAVYEREFKAILESQGWLVSKSGASLGYDLIAVKSEGGGFKARLIEIKSRSSWYAITHLLKSWDQPGEIWACWKGHGRVGEIKERWFTK